MTIYDNLGSLSTLDVCMIRLKQVGLLFESWLNLIRFTKWRIYFIINICLNICIETHETNIS